MDIFACFYSYNSDFSPSYHFLSTGIFLIIEGILYFFLAGNLKSLLDQLSKVDHSMLGSTTNPQIESLTYQLGLLTNGLSKAIAEPDPTPMIIIEIIKLI